MIWHRGCIYQCPFPYGLLSSADDRAEPQSISSHRWERNIAPRGLRCPANDECLFIIPSNSLHSPHVGHLWPGQILRPGTGGECASGIGGGLCGECKSEAAAIHSRM